MQQSKIPYLSMHCTTSPPCTHSHTHTYIHTHSHTYTHTYTHSYTHSHTQHTQTHTLTQDQHTIMCAWAVRDHNPKCQLYVQILKPENRLHLEVADHIVCEGELKYALVANSCHCPGITTLVREQSSLLHRARTRAKSQGSEYKQGYWKVVDRVVLHEAVRACVL